MSIDASVEIGYFQVRFSMDHLLIVKKLLDAMKLLVYSQFISKESKMEPDNGTTVVSHREGNVSNPVILYVCQ